MKATPSDSKKLHIPTATVAKHYDLIHQSHEDCGECRKHAERDSDDQLILVQAKHGKKNKRKNCFDTLALNLFYFERAEHR